MVKFKTFSKLICVKDKKNYNVQNILKVVFFWEILLCWKAVTKNNSRVKYKTFTQLMCVKGQKKNWLCLCMWEDGNIR